MFNDFSLAIDYDAQTKKFALTGVKKAGNNDIATIQVVSATTALRLLGVTNSLSTDGALSETKILEFPNAVNTNRTKIFIFLQMYLIHEILITETTDKPFWQKFKHKECLTQ